MSRNANAEVDCLHAELVHVMNDMLTPWLDRMDRIGADHALVIERSRDAAAEDLMTLVLRDPAARASWRYVLEAYSCFRAVLAYRLAHTLLTTPGPDPDQLLTLARSISERAKVDTAVEIHPAAEIGPRFVVDHGAGTVIGEGVVIGSDCYILQGVVLGSLGIADNVSGRRHPRLGDRVQVGGLARVLGSITVGDDVLIGSHALVRTDIPDGCHVVVVSECQVVTEPRPVGHRVGRLPAA